MKKSERRLDRKWYCFWYCDGSSLHRSSSGGCYHRSVILYSSVRAGNFTCCEYNYRQPLCRLATSEDVRAVKTSVCLRCMAVTRVATTLLVPSVFRFLAIHLTNAACRFLFDAVLLPELAMSTLTVDFPLPIYVTRADVYWVPYRRVDLGIIYERCEFYGSSHGASGMLW